MRRLSTAAATLLAPFQAFAQSPTPPAPPEVGAGEPVSTLMFFTLGAGLGIAVVALLWFLRRRSNRDAASKALNPNDPANR